MALICKFNDNTRKTHVLKWSPFPFGHSNLYHLLLMKENPPKGTEMDSFQKRCTELCNNNKA
jgi:hypothetical protein